MEEIGFQHPGAAAGTKISMPSQSRRATVCDFVCYSADTNNRERPTMRSILLFLVGVPLPIILLLALCTHHF